MSCITAYVARNIIAASSVTAALGTLIGGLMAYFNTEKFDLRIIWMLGFFFVLFVVVATFSIALNFCCKSSSVESNDPDSSTSEDTEENRAPRQPENYPNPNADCRDDFADLEGPGRPHLQSQNAPLETDKKDPQAPETNSSSEISEGINDADTHSEHQSDSTTESQTTKENTPETKSDLNSPSELENSESSTDGLSYISPIGPYTSCKGLNSPERKLEVGKIVANRYETWPPECALLNKAKAEEPSIISNTTEDVDSNILSSDISTFKTDSDEKSKESSSVIISDLNKSDSDEKKSASVDSKTSDTVAEIVATLISRTAGSHVDPHLQGEQGHFQVDESNDKVGSFEEMKHDLVSDDPLESFQVPEDCSDEYVRVDEVQRTEPFPISCSVNISISLADVTYGDESGEINDDLELDQNYATPSSADSIIRIEDWYDAKN